MPARLARWLPCLTWAHGYNRHTAASDTLAAVIVTLMLIPQSLAYAMLAGLPPVTGLYASILPLIAYTLFGTSRALAVGPVAVVSLMTAAALTPLFAPGSAEYLGAAMLLAMLSGAILLGMALLRLGFLANFLSHPVISGFISASGLLIALGQLKHVLGLNISGDTALLLVPALVKALPTVHWPTAAIGLSSLAFLFAVRSHLAPLLRALGMPHALAGNLARLGPVLALIGAVAAVQWGQLVDAGVHVVGAIPQGLPSLALPAWDASLALTLLPAAILISLVGFVESVSVAQTLAARHRQRIDPNQELVALGSANVAAALGGGFPVTGGFARSVVNYDAGARTPLAGALTALGITITVLFFTPLFHNLPHAVLAATIIVAVLSLVDLKALVRTWRYSRQDGLAMAGTIGGVLLLGVEAGILIGVGLSLLLFLWRTSQPHMAVVGQMPGSEHFRNIARHNVIQSPTVLSVRVDESLYFPNARYLEDQIVALVEAHPATRHLVLMCSGVNLIDASALTSLEAIAARLATADIQLHLSEVKGPVMDQLQRTDFLKQLNGEVFLCQYDALRSLDPDSTARALQAGRAST
ncbi:SulP family inorganic anion transporter [Isoalcanivorax beigongshangi]|uniref:SulP family inorganic anion transporter n=1 Tax=Isoalcanivorax beigongshangi TaxID=3238810 RepID=A0ABV4AH84_9GAMM